MNIIEWVRPHRIGDRGCSSWQKDMLTDLGLLTSKKVYGVSSMYNKSSMIESYFIANRSASIEKVTSSDTTLVGSEQWDIRLQLPSGLREKGYHAMNRKRSSSILAHLDSCLGKALRVTQNTRPERDESTAIFVFGCAFAVANDDGAERFQLRLCFCDLKHALASYAL